MITTVISLVAANWEAISIGLFAVSEIMALNPKWKSNGIFNLAINLLKKAKKPASN